jgi:hypothetical protein
MSTLSDKEIYANRLKAVAYLKQPHLRKASGVLERPDGSCCCFGHMCNALAIPKEVKTNGGIYFEGTFDGTAPDTLISKLGMFDSFGRTGNGFDIINTEQEPIVCLVDLNDLTDMTPQQIGEYLESVIMGGTSTPWKSISI